MDFLEGLSNDQFVIGGAAVGGIAGYFLLGRNSLIKGLIGAGIGAAAAYYMRTGEIPLVGSFQVTAPYTPNVFVDARRTGYGYGYPSSSSYPIYQYYQQTNPIYQYQQSVATALGRDIDDVFLYPNVPSLSPLEQLQLMQYQQEPSYYYPSSSSSSYYYPTYQQYQQQTYSYSPLNSCIQRCNQYYY